MATHLKVLPKSLVENGDVGMKSTTSTSDIERELHALVDSAVKAAKTSEESFMAFEKGLLPTVQLVGRLVLLLFLMAREERERARTPERLVKDGHPYRRRPAQPRNLDTLFGVVRYFRTYMRGPAGHGYHPLDAALGLTSDRLSMNVLGLGARLATMMSFARAHMTLAWFLGSSPSTEVLENTVLGLGRRTQEWFARAPAPKDDGEVLVIQFDSKGAPTATEAELKRRRGPRRPNPFPNSARHRSWERRNRYGAKRRRKKGDKSKNARMATLVVMYTLHRSKGEDGTERLLGPNNRRVYASFAPKKHVFAIARREADKRGFTKESGKLVQIVTDGDEDLKDNVQHFFPEAIHTVDVMHVIEYIHQAGQCFFREGSDGLKTWMEFQKERLYGGQECEIVEELKRRLTAIPATGPGNKGRRERLAGAISYLEKRLSKMNYESLLERDLEIGSGAVEGAVKNIIGARFDFGGSRWIRDRAEALLQLRCIEANGDWDAFIQWVHDDHLQRALKTGERIRIQHNSPSPLPTLGLAA